MKRQAYSLDEDSELGGIVELRIHGMGGATPEDQVEDPHPIQVGGDRIAGFYRSSKITDFHREGYSWGGLTSRDSVRSFWVVLLPFALINAAGYLTPWGGGIRRERNRRAIHAISRLLALTMTLVLLAWIAAIGMDLYAYQCGGREACREGRWWLAIFQHVSFGSEHPGRRLVVGALVPLTVLCVIWFLSYRSWRSYEKVDANGTDTPERVDLRASSFWQGEVLVRGLRTLHVAAGIGLLAFALGYSVRSLATPMPGPVAPHPLWVLPLVEIALIAALVLLFRGSGFRLLASRSARMLVVAMPTLTLIWIGVLAWTATGLPEVAPDVAQPLPRLGGWFRLLFDVALVLFLALTGFLVAMRLRTQPRPAPPIKRGRAGFLGFAPLVVAVLGFTLLSAILNGTSVVVANLLGEPVPYGQSPLADITLPQVSTRQPPIAYPQLYDLFAVGFSLGFVVLVVGLLLWWVSTRRRARNQVEAVRREYDEREGPYPFGDDDPWCLRVARARAVARMVDLVDVPLTLVMAVALGLQIVGAILIHSGRGVGTIWAAGPFESFSGWGAIRQMSVWFVSLIPLGLVLLARRSFRDLAWRRRLGILWDLLTFWPRAFHPMAPPSYAERAVPDLKHRLERIQEAQGRVLLSGHSQGSVLAVAALLQLDERKRRGLMLLTHGSPLGRLYRRFFPDYFGSGILVGLGREISEETEGDGPRWLNLYRLTDYIGGPIFEEEDAAPEDLKDRVDDMLLDDPERRSHPPGEQPARAKMHSDYMSQRGATQSLAAMLEALRERSLSQTPAEGVAPPETHRTSPAP